MNRSRGARRGAAALIAASLLMAASGRPAARPGGQETPPAHARAGLLRLLGIEPSPEPVHQGRIEVESGVKQGTTFKVWLPVFRPGYVA